MERAIKFTLIALVCLILSAGAFIGGVAFDRVMTGRPAVLPEPKGSEVGERADEVVRILSRDSLEPSSESSMSAGAIRGVLESLGDPYADYFDARHLKFFEEQNSGEFDGIGVTVSEKDGVPYVVSVIKDTPAARAGLKPDDRIVAIDGTTREKWSLDEVVKRIRGKAGTKVTVEIRRGPEPGKVHTFSIARAKIDLPNVESSMKEGGVGYIRLFSFNAKSTDELEKSVKALAKTGATSFVLDLRDNPGGLLEQAVRVSSLFVRDGVIVRVEERGKPETVHNTTGNFVTKAPLVVLVNGNSASASEIVAGALQDHARATIVGETSFGKGSVQTVRDLEDGGAIKFTIAHYLTPKKRVINGKGVVPDITVKMDEKTLKAKGDIQLERALKVARGSSTAAR